MSSDVLQSAWRFADAVRPLFDDVGIVLFGSQVKGYARPTSDIDIAVLVPELKECEQNPYRVLEVDMLLSNIAMMIDTRIEPHFIQCNHDRSGFTNTIMATGIKLRPNHELAYPDEEIELISY